MGCVTYDAIIGAAVRLTNSRVVTCCALRPEKGLAAPRLGGGRKGNPPPFCCAISASCCCSRAYCCVRAWVPANDNARFLEPLQSEADGYHDALSCWLQSVNSGATRAQKHSRYHEFVDCLQRSGENAAHSAELLG